MKNISLLIIVLIVLVIAGCGRDVSTFENAIKGH